MRIFVTGATGYVGRAVVKALVRAGHQVTGLVRSAERAELLEQLSATPLRGNLMQPASYRAAAAEHDAIIHVGFDHGPAGASIDRTAVDTLVEAARATTKLTTLIYTSGVLCLGNTGGEVDEYSPTDPIPLVAWRPAHEDRVLLAGSRTVWAAVIRPGFVYGGTKGLLAGYFQTAISDGAAAYVGDGTNRVALVHRNDLAELYRMVVEHRAQGIFHGVDGAAPRVAELARAASEAAGRAGATKRTSREDARKMMGGLADAICTDQVVVTQRASEVAWKPRRKPALDAMADLFAEWRGQAS